MRDGQHLTRSLIFTFYRNLYWSENFKSWPISTRSEEGNQVKPLWVLLKTVVWTSEKRSEPTREIYPSRGHRWGLGAGQRQGALVVFPKPMVLYSLQSHSGLFFHLTWTGTGNQRISAEKRDSGNGRSLVGPGIFFVNTLLLSHTLETVSVTQPRVRAPTCASISYPSYRVL